MRRAAIGYTAPERPSLTDPNNSWLKRKVLGIWYAVIGVLSRPAYAVPLLLNVTGSVWFFVLIGKAGEFYHIDGGLRVHGGRLTWSRIELDGADYEFAGVFVYGFGRVVGGEEGYQ